MTQAAPLCLVTRPEPEATRFAAALGDRFGVETLLAPVIDVSVISVSVKLDRFAGVILTSANGARSLERLTVPREMPCFAVGEKTASVAQSLGYSARAMGGDAEGLIAELIASQPKTPLLHLRGEQSRGDVASRLSEAGLACEEIVVYQQDEQEWPAETFNALASHPTLILPLFSPRSAQIVSSRMGNCEGIWPVALSAAVAKEVKLPGARPTVVSASPTEAAMMDAIASVPPMRAWVEMADRQS
ncbi:MAG: uroporphyrinogen-III synthase [Pseudomonadota bacterium]